MASLADFEKLVELKKKKIITQEEFEEQRAMLLSSDQNATSDDSSAGITVLVVIFVVLGILAVIGVLSIVGIYGYRAAMTKLKANEIISLTNQFYVMAVTADGGNCRQGVTNTQLSVLPTGSIQNQPITLTMTSCPQNDYTSSDAVITISGIDDQKIKEALLALSSEMSFTLKVE